MSNKDEVLEILQKRVEDMDKRDKTGLSLLEIYKPYSDLYNYTMMKLSLLTEEEKSKMIKSLKLYTKKLNQEDFI